MATHWDDWVIECAAQDWSGDLQLGRKLDLGHVEGLEASLDDLSGMWLHVKSVLYAS